MNTELHLPWDNDALQALLLQITKTGEATKVDFKRQLNITSAEHHAELLKDISALANTYDYAYQNHGFLILGVTGNTQTFTKFDQDADSLQARIDDLINKHIEPFIQTQVRIFGTGEQTWGVIVVPPTRTAPHVIVKDIQKRSRGDIFVRRGTTTDKAQPSDYVRFFRLHLDEHTYELRVQLEQLKQEVMALKQRPSVLIERRNNDLPLPAAQGEPEKQTGEPFDLLRAIDREFERETDPIASGVFKEALKIRDFLASDTVPWAFNNLSAERGRQCLEEMEKNAMSFWTAIGNLALQDNTGKYDDAILHALACLAQKQEAPTSVSYTEWGIYVRYFPLVVSLHILFTAAVFKRRFLLLKKILALELVSRSYNEDPVPLPNVLFFIRRASEVFQTRNPEYPKGRWCDAVGMVIEPIIKRVLNFEDPTWNKRGAFFVGEFVLCLTPIDVIDPDTKKPSKRHPSSGIYLYFFEAGVFIGRFLRSESKSIAEVFKRPFEEVLKDFDNNAVNLISPGCSGDGFVCGAMQHAFPESVNRSDVSGKT